MKILVAVLWLILPALFTLPVYAGSADTVVGIWNTQKKEAKIEIYKCGDKYCGKLVELTEPNYPAYDDKGMGGLPKVDRENPDPKLRSKPLLGLQIMKGFSFSGSDTWEGGIIYDAETGSSYRCKMTLLSPNRLKVRGFIGISLLGGSETWTREPVNRP